VEFCRKYWGRDPITLNNPVIYDPTLLEMSGDPKPPEPKVKIHKHCRAINGTHDGSAKFANDDEAIAYAISKGYKAITHKTDSLTAAYYFKNKPSKFRIALTEDDKGWEFTSWGIE
jgi:hypothetical protein